MRNRSLSNARWFCVEKRKIGKRNLYLTKNRFGKNGIPQPGIRIIVFHQTVIPNQWIATGCILSIGYYSVLLHWIQTSNLKNLNSISIRVKELFEPIVSSKKCETFALFISIYMSNRSLSNARWFYAKNAKLGMKICF